MLEWCWKHQIIVREIQF